METEDFVAEDDLRGMDPSVVSLVLESDKIYEHGTKANADRMSPWLERVSDRTESRTKCGSRRLSQPKDNRSVTPRRLSRPSFQAREYEIDFRHHPDTGRYMEEYRNAKLQKQEANLRTAVLKSERRRASEPVVNCSQPTRQLREKPAQEQTSADEVGQKSKPLIVISSRGSSRPCSLPLEGHFQGRKLQGRSQVLPRTTYVHRESLWYVVLFIFVLVHLLQLLSALKFMSPLIGFINVTTALNLCLRSKFITLLGSCWERMDF